MMRNNQTSDRGSNPSKRRATPIPVQPPRIPTPMPATNNNNPHSRVVVGGCNKDQLQAQKKQYESQSTSSTKNSTKYLDNDVKTSWINPRLISKIDMEAVISSEYVPPVQRANLYNRNNFQSNQVQHQIHQQQQQQQQQNKRERTAVIQQQQEWETPASTCSGSNRTTSTTSGGKCQQMARQSSIILSVASMPHTDAVLPCKRAERTAAKHVVSMKHAARHKSHYGTPKPVKHSLNCSDKVTINSGKQHSSNFNSSNNQHKTLPNTTLPVAYSDSVSVSSYASAAGPVTDRASASGVFGLYSESKYTYSVNRLPGNPAQTSAAAAFFARAAQKLNLSASPHRRKRHSSGDEEYTTGGFSGVIQRTPPPVPPALLRRIGVKEITGVGKVKVMLRVSTPTNGSPQEGSATGSFFSLDKRKKQVTLFDPAVCSGVSAPEDRRVGVAAPKMFAFDAIFSQDDSQTEVCSSALTDVIHAVINGSDGCLFCFGHAGLGKSYTMLGTADNANTLGVIPCAISWLFRGINEQKQKTGARFSVRVSAVEVCGPSNQLKDLLAGHANDSEQSPGVYLRDDPLFGTQLQNHAELRVPTAEKAAWYLDAAIDSRGGTRSSENRDSHLLFTLHVYQYSVAGKGGVAGGRSRLHLIDLGNSERGKSSGGIPLSGLGNILLAIFNGQKHLPYREHKLTHLLKECLGSLTCHAAMIAHVSPYAQNYTDTLTTVQLASRIHRMRRRKIKFVSAGTGNGSGGSSGEEATRTTGTSSEPDPSSSDLSADTVIYVGPADEGTDGEHPPVYIPSLNSGDNRCVMSKALRGSCAEQRPSKMPTPQKPAAVVATEEKIHKSPSLKNPTTQSCKTSPAHSSTPKSSPIRNPSSKQSIKATPVDPAATTLASKIPVFGNANGCVSTSDEQWIDGPRISRSRVAEARHFMKEACHVKKRETWIDGPMQAGSVTGLNLNHGPNNAGYGYMDSHKKSMIRKWVENQTSQIQRVKHTSPKNEPKTAAVKESFKEMTTFKTCDDPDSLIKEVRPLVEDNWKKHEVEECVIRTGLKISNSKHGGSDVIPECVSPEEKGSTEDETEKDKKDEELDDDDDDDDEEEDGMAEIPPALPLIQPLSSREVSMESLNERLKERLRSTVDFESQEDEYDEDMGSDDDEVLEIIEVEEPLEPVPTQDCCLQVTEEDIALCMGYAENPLPEVDQENPLEHPLRILSQENLTVVSTFTDSMSVYTDLERILPRHRYGPNYNMAPDMHSYGMYNEYEDPECPPSVRNGNLHDSTRQKFDQLARLHELYTHRLAKANVTNSPTYIEHKQQQRSLSRCESLSLSDMLYGVGAHETSSIYSEPAYVPQQEKFCENCKVSMSRPATAQNWYTDPTISASTTHLESTDYGFPSLGGRFQRYCHKFPKDNHCSLASLRHPDGASNPNLKEETERIPGNGASLSDHEDDDVEAKLLPSTRTVTGKDHSFRGEEDLPPTLPPPLHLPSSEKVNRRLLSIESGLASMKLNQKQTEGYDSGHDSTPRTSKHSPAAISRRAESGYDSVVRDSESSSIDSDTSRLSHSLHTRRGKCRHKHDRSFCSWLLNPFTCKYIDEPPETHF